MSVVSTNSQVLFKKCIKHSEPDTTQLEFIASICLDDGSSLDRSSIAEVVIGKNFTEADLIDLDFLKNSVISFSWKISKEGTNIVVDISPLITFLAKYWFSSYGLRYCQPIRLQDSSKCNISKKKWWWKLFFACR